MNKLLLLSALLSIISLSATKVYSQNPGNTVYTEYMDFDDEAYDIDYIEYDTVVDQATLLQTSDVTPPKFKGGEAAMFRFLDSVLIVPQEVADNKISGRVIVRFLVDKDGSIQSPSIQRSLSPDCDKAALEAVSTHPIAMSIVEEVQRRGVEFTTAKDVKEISGHGMVGTVEGHTVLVGNGRLLAKENIAAPLIDYVYGSEVFVAVDGQYVGRIIIADALKADSKEAIRRMNGKGYQTVMLTGDVAASAKYIAQQVGIQGVRAELLPQDKLEVVQSLRNDHGSVMFVGDGINDAPVLTGADVGGAMGSGADSAIEAADVVYMNSNLDSVWRSLSIAERTLSIAWQNIFFAIAVKIIVMVAGVFGFANMWVAVFADTGVSILCIFNSVRIFYSK